MNFMADVYSGYPIMLKTYISYLLIINLITFLLMGIDKMRSQTDKWRIRETTFIITGFLGGAVGILLGMVFYHHKLNKKKFYLGIPLTYIINRIVSSLIYNYLIFIK